MNKIAGKISLIKGDCMDYMRSLPDNAVDLAVVDPPYGDAGQSGGEYCRSGGILPPTKNTSRNYSE